VKRIKEYLSDESCVPPSGLLVLEERTWQLRGGGDFVRRGMGSGGELMGFIY